MKKEIEELKNKLANMDLENQNLLQTALAAQEDQR